MIEGVCAAAGLPVRFLTPAQWKRIVSIPPGRNGAKDAARSGAIRRWPAQAALFKLVKSDGRLDPSGGPPPRLGLPIDRYLRMEFGRRSKPPRSRKEGHECGVGREWNAAIRMTIHRGRKIDGLGVRGVLHGLDALLDRLKSCSEHGCGQLGYALAIVHSGFDPLLDQPLL